MLEHLTNNGRAGIIVPEGIIFKSDKAYKQLRKLLVEDNYLVGVISLPGGVFNPYSGVKTAILWIDKALAKKTDNIIFLKINNDGFDLGAQRRPIEVNDLPDAFANAIAYKEAVLTRTEFKVPNKDVILVEKSKLAETGDFNLSGERHVIKANGNSNFPIISLIDKVSLIQGVTYKKEDEVSEGGTLVLRANNIALDGRLYLGDVKQISKKNEFKDSQMLKSGDIFICLASGSKSHVGKVAYIESDTNYYFGGFMGAIRITSSNLIPKYLFYLLKQDRFNEYLSTAILGANINNLSSTILYEFQIPFPPISVQEEIVAELNSYQKIIDGAKQVVDNWKPHININPKWSIMKMKNVCFVNPESSDPSELWDDWFTYVDIASIDNSTNSIAQLNRISISEAPTRARRIVKPHDVIISTVRPNLKAFYYFDTVPDRTIVSTGFAVLRANDLIHPKYMYYMLLSDYMVDQMISRMGRGSYPSINQSDVNELNIPLPDLQTQCAIIEKIEREQDYVNGSRQLKTIYELKITDLINWL